MHYEPWLAVLPDTELIFEDLGGFIASYPKPYGARSVSAITSGDQIIIVRTDAFSFSRITPGVDSVQITHIDIPKILLTEAQKNNFSGYAERIHNLVRDNMPQHRPAVLPHILTDEMNGFWAGYESVDFEEIRWLYIASTGQITKELYLPSRYRPHAITGNLMVGIQTESDGSQSINGFKINPS